MNEEMNEYNKYIPLDQSKSTEDTRNNNQQKTNTVQLEKSQSQIK